MNKIIAFLLALAALPALAQKSDDIPLTRAFDAPMKDCADTSRYPSVEACFSRFTEANHGFILAQKDSAGRYIKSPYVALLLHGLSDSPYFYRDIALKLYREGINVIAPRHSGHGTRDYHLQRVSRFDWYQDLQWAKEQALELGDEIILGGMSLGGSLAVRDALYADEKPAGLLLFSPALVMPWKFRLSCVFKGGYEAEKEYGVGIRYQRISNNGTCQLYRINKEIRQRISQLNQLDIPVLTVLTVYDTAIDHQKTYSLLKRFDDSNKSRLALHTAPAGTDKEGLELLPENLPADVSFIEAPETLPHASVLLRPSEKDFTPETNPHYSAMEKELEEFIRLYF